MEVYNMFPQVHSLRLRERGQVTIPQPVRKKLATSVGDILNLVQVGDIFLLAPRKPHAIPLARQFTAIMEEEGVSLAYLLEGLAEERRLSQQEQ